MEIMAVAIKENYQKTLDEQNLEVRNMVLAGLEQVKKGNTKDFDEVCDRLEKKYSDAALHN
jgi:accessory colonization factor AcfC